MRFTAESFEPISDRIGMKNWEREVQLGGQAQLEIDFDLASERKDNSPAVCVLISRYKGGHIKYRFRREFHCEPEIYCLMLRLSGTEDRQYKRVGVGVN